MLQDDQEQVRMNGCFKEENSKNLKQWSFVNYMLKRAVK